MMNKPKGKRRVGIFSANNGIIGFDTDEQAVEIIKEYGNVYHSRGSRYSLAVDTRFDFEDVVKFMEAM